MTDTAGLERGYRRWLRWYPQEFRREHETEMLGVLLSGARAGQRQPTLLECLDLLCGAWRIRLYPRASRSNRSAGNVVRLLYLGAVVQIAVALTIVATIGDVRANVVTRNPAPTDDLETSSSST